MTAWVYAADALSIAALAIMAGASRTAWRRIAPEARLPLRFDRQGRPAWRLSRTSALALGPALAATVGLVLLWLQRTHAGQGDAAGLLFGLRATLAALFALAHLTWLGRALAALAAEGKVKP